MNLQEVNEWLEENYINTRLSDSDLKVFYLNNDTVKKNIKDLEDSVDKLPSLHKDDNSKVDDSEVTKHNEKHWKVYTPHTEEASKKYGAGTRWCTAAHNNNQFHNYNDEGPLHI
ncbi:MAG: hypothetical protein EBS19_12500, partial [Spirochaetia bacterium]|nr:hypothetical protein [Spirochaetia bacterium]